MSYKWSTFPIRFKWTVILISLYIIAIPFQRLLRFDTIEYKLQITELIFLLICLSFIFSIKIKDVLNFKKKINKIDITVFIWLVVGLVNLMVNQNTSTIIEFIGQFYLISYYFIIRIVLSSFNNIGNLMAVFFQSFKLMGIIILIVILVGTILYFGGIDIGVFWKFNDYPYFGTLHRLKALTNEPVMLTSILSIPFFIGLIEWNQLKFNIRSRSFIYLIIISILLFFTFSKSLPLLVISTCLMLLYFYKKSLSIVVRRLLLAGVILIFAIQLIMSHFIINKDINRLGKGYGQEKPIYKFKPYYIYETWYLVQKENCLKLFLQNPFFGVGGGNLQNFIINDKINFKNSTYDPLSTYSGVLSEYGLIGISSLFFLFFSLFRSFNYLQNSLIEYRNLFFLLFSYICLEAICTDIMNFRHFWVSLAFYSTIVTFNTVGKQNRLFVE